MNEKVCRMLLIVDNDPAQAKKIQETAKTNADILDFEMVLAQNPDEARRLIDAEAGFMLAVVDLRLEGRLDDHEASIQPGLRVIKYLKAKLPKCVVIALTSNYATNEGQDALRCGANDFLSTKWVGVKDWTWLLGERLKIWKGAVSPAEPITA